MKRIGCLFLIFVLLLAGCGQPVLTWQEQYGLGTRYLSEGNYEEAVLAFTSAIEIDPMQAPAFVARADAYMNAPEAQHEMAEQDYLKAIELDGSVAETYLKLAELYILQDNTESAINTLEQGLEITNHLALEDMLFYAANRPSNAAKKVLDWYVEAMQSENYESIIRLRNGMDISAPFACGFFSNRVYQNCCYDGNNCYTDMTGTGLKLIDDRWVYYGDLVDGEPNGDGACITINPRTDVWDGQWGFTLFIGSWENGKPDGYGTYYYAQTYAAPTDNEYDIRIYEGIWNDGLADGEIIEKGKRKYKDDVAFMPDREFHYACSQGRYVLDNRWKDISYDEKYFNHNRVTNGYYLEEINQHGAILYNTDRVLEFEPR